MATQSSAQELALLTSRVNALRSQVGQLLVAMNSLLSIAGSGGAITPYLVGGDGQLYKLTMPVVDGTVTLDWEPVAAYPSILPILGGDGALYNLSLPVVNGAITLTWEAA